MSNFELHPQLLKDTYSVCDLEICRVLLMNDARFPWLILVPRIDAARELHHLDQATFSEVNQEIRSCASMLEAQMAPYKINIAALGNQVEQLHIHIIARTQADAAWPAPVWGFGEPVPYTEVAAQALIATLNQALV